MPPSLFRTGRLRLACGRASAFKVDCDALTGADWLALAGTAHRVLPPFGRVVGVPRGGLPFAAALGRYATFGCPTLLLADDVLTTGGSLERCRGVYAPAPAPVIGVVVFARAECPPWVTALFRLHPDLANL